MLLTDCTSLHLQLRLTVHSRPPDRTASVIRIMAKFPMAISIMCTITFFSSLMFVSHPDNTSFLTCESTGSLSVKGFFTCFGFTGEDCDSAIGSTTSAGTGMVSFEVSRSGNQLNTTTIA